jgi:hypothetical protein
MRHVSMKSMNFLDLEVVGAYTGRAPLEGEGARGRAGAIHSQTTLTFLLASPYLNPTCPHTSSMVPIEA